MGIHELGTFATFRREIKSKSTFSSKSTSAIYLYTLSEGTHGTYRLLNLETNQVVSSRSVTFYPIYPGAAPWNIKDIERQVRELSIINSHQDTTALDQTHLNDTVHGPATTTFDQTHQNTSVSNKDGTRPYQISTAIDQSIVLRNSNNLVEVGLPIVK